MTFTGWYGADGKIAMDHTVIAFYVITWFIMRRLYIPRVIGYDIIWSVHVLIVTAAGVRHTRRADSRQ